MNFTVSGIDGWLHLFAFLLFGIAAIVAWLWTGGEPAPGYRPRIWPLFIAAGLCLEALSQLVH
ncbi:MAG: hypothetical protein M3Y33_11855 [Actinomycetota bacterium]|nr:hypothetical protein [Actinomycetota bacterium]